MLALQREYHCYNSARLEAAVEALEKGWRIEDVPIRKFLTFDRSSIVKVLLKKIAASRFCLDLLNEELNAQIEATNLQ